MSENAAGRVRGLALAALAVATGLNLLLAGLDEATFFDLALPAGVLLALLGTGLVAGALSLFRQNLPLLAASLVFLLLPALETRDPAATPANVILTAFWALAVLSYAELAHMNARYKALRAAVTTAASAQGNITRAAKEYLSTFGIILAWTATLTGGALGLYAILRALGPRQWQHALEMGGPQGIVLVTLTFLFLAILAALAKGGDFSWLKRERTRAAETAGSLEEVDLDAIE